MHLREADFYAWKISLATPSRLPEGQSTPTRVPMPRRSEQFPRIKKKKNGAPREVLEGADLEAVDSHGKTAKHYAADGDTAKAREENTERSRAPRSTGDSTEFYAVLGVAHLYFSRCASERERSERERCASSRVPLKHKLNT